MSRLSSTSLTELWRLVRLSFPIAATQVGLMSIGAVETLIVGRAGTEALGAVALGNLWLYGTVLIANGVVLGADPLISQAHGAGDYRGVALAFQRGLVLSLLLAFPLGALWLATEPVLLALGQDAGLAREAGRFVAVQTPTAAGFLVFTINRQYLAGRGIVAAPVWVLVAGNLLNASVCWVLVLGGFGLPALGVYGAGIAAGLSRAFIAILLLFVTFRAGLHRGAWVPWSRESFQARPIAAMFALGLPIGIQFGLEMWAFQAGTLLAGRLGKIELAAHTIVLNLAGMSFMVPLGISMAASVRVGNLVGAGALEEARQSSLVALALGALVMGGSAFVFLLGRDLLPHLYGATPSVAAAAAAILPIAAAFQLFDGIQVVGGGVLRGMGRTRPAAVFNLVGYYLLGLPLAVWLAFERGAGLPGVWIGLAVGLLVVSIALVLWLLQRDTFVGVRRAS